jgi:predicted nucleotide-binding protein
VSSPSIGFVGQPSPRDTSERAGYLQLAEPSEATRSQLVFVVHGRNVSARLAIFEFLRSIDLCPIEWHQAIAATGKASPYISEVVDAGIEAAQAVVVLWTPDEVVALRPEYANGEDDPDVRPGLQSRPNVMFEAGLALGRAPDRVVLVELGHMRHFSDMLGRHTLRLSNSVASRKELAIRLRTAGCDVDLSGTEWHTAGDFSSPPPPALSRWRIPRCLDRQRGRRPLKLGASGLDEGGVGYGLGFGDHEVVAGVDVPAAAGFRGRCASGPCRDWPGPADGACSGQQTAGLN